MGKYHGHTYVHNVPRTLCWMKGEHSKRRSGLVGIAVMHTCVLRALCRTKGEMPRTCCRRRLYFGLSKYFESVSYGTRARMYFSLFSWKQAAPYQRAASCARGVLVDRMLRMSFTTLWKYHFCVPRVRVVCSPRSRLLLLTLLLLLLLFSCRRGRLAWRTGRRGTPPRRRSSCPR